MYSIWHLQCCTRFFFHFFPTEITVCQILTCCHKDQYNCQLQGHSLSVDLHDFINVFTLSGIIARPWFKGCIAEKMFCEMKQSFCSKKIYPNMLIPFNILIFLWHDFVIFRTWSYVHRPCWDLDCVIDSYHHICKQLSLFYRWHA